MFPFGYDYKRFWNSRLPNKESYKLRDFHFAVFDTIKELRPKSVLEVGCGAGKILLQLEKQRIPLLVGIDISKNRLQIAKNYVSRSLLFCENALDLELLPDNCFDLILSVNCLMCLKLEDVDFVCQNLERIAGKNIVLLERFVGTEPMRHPNRYTFNYEYEKMFDFLGMRLIKKWWFGEQLLLVFEKGRGK